MLPSAEKCPQVAAAEESSPRLQTWNNLLVEIFSKAHAKIVHKEDPRESRHEEMLTKKSFESPFNLTIAGKKLRFIER